MFFGFIYKKGHIFRICNISQRGLDIIDDAGRRIDECGLIQDRFELIDIKEVRLIKLKKIIAK